MYCTNCGRSKPTDEKFCSFCGRSDDPSDTDIMTMSDGIKKSFVGGSQQSQSYGAKRSLAWVVDVFLIFLALILSLIAFSSVFGLNESHVELLAKVLGLFIPMAYFSYFESKRAGATLGKLLFKFEVVTAGQTKLTLRQAIARAFFKSIPIFSVVSAVMFFVRKDKQTIHDLVVSTQVIMTESKEFFDNA